MSAQFFAMDSKKDPRVTCGGGAPQGGAPAHLTCFRSNQPSWNDIVQVYGALKNPFEIHYPWFSMGICAVHGMDLKSKMWGKKIKIVTSLLRRGITSDSDSSIEIWPICVQKKPLRSENS